METKKTNRRSSQRKEVAALTVEYLISLEDMTKLAQNLEIIEVSPSGLLLLCPRSGLKTPYLKENMTLDSLIGTEAFIRIPDMNLEIAGTVTRTQFLGKNKGYLIALDYTEDAPEYWRECLAELLPTPGELD